MKKKFLLYIFLCFFAVNLMFGATKTWNAGMDGIWNLSTNWTPVGVPGPSDDVVIDTDYTVTISINRTVKSITLLAGGDLIVANSSTLTVTGSSGKDGISLSADSVATSLTVHGDIICTDHTKDGIDVNELGFIEVSSTGSIHVEDTSDDGFELSDNLTNHGTITITNVGGDGIYAKGDIEVPLRKLYNYGSITISDCDFGIDQKNHWIFENYGTVTLFDADPTKALIDDGSNFNNFGTFKGNGNVENGNNYDVSFKPGSTLAPGTSVGELFFLEQVNFSSTTLQIEIEGASNYDKVVVDTGDSSGGSVLIAGATLNLTGSYVPVGGEEFMFLEKKSTGAITGTFSGLPEGSIVNFNGMDMTISYSGGDGNDITFTVDGALPVELVDFDARAMQKEVKLSWTTANEINNDYFTIERSDDGRNFKELASIPGSGNSTDFQEYLFSDRNPVEGMAYYRLKQTDFDGTFSYSDIEHVEYRDEQAVKVYPTIVNEAIFIETANSKNDINALISDLNGKVLKSFIISKDEYQKEILLNDLLTGNYFITIQNNNTLRTIKFVKL